MIRLTPDPTRSEVLVGFSQEFAPLPPAQRPGWSLLSPGAAPSDDPPRAEVVAWSGSHAQLDGGGLFDADPRTWGPRGWESLERACERVARDTSVVYLIRPHARHVVSDVPGIRRFASVIAANHSGRFGLVLDPASMLDVRHLEQRTAVDTLRRLAEELPTLGTAAFPLVGVVLANVRRAADRLDLVGENHGEVAAGLIRELFG